MRARFDNSHCECSIIFSVCDKLYLLCSRIIFSLVWQIYCAAILTADHACVFVKYVGLRCRKIEPLRLDASYADYGNHHHVLPAHMQTPCLFMGQEQGILIPEPVFLLWGLCMIFCLSVYNLFFLSFRTWEWSVYDPPSATASDTSWCSRDSFCVIRGCTPFQAAQNLARQTRRRTRTRICFSRFLCGGRARTPSPKRGTRELAARTPVTSSQATNSCRNHGPIIYAKNKSPRRS